MKKDNTHKRILKQKLSTLISKYSQSNVLEELAKTHHNNPIQLIEIGKIIDNKFLKKVSYSRSKIAHFIENYQRNILLEPLIVRSLDEKYEVIIGRKRLAAARLAKIEAIPVIVMNYNDEETLLILLAKARDTQESNVLELAYIFNNLVMTYGYTHENLAKLMFTSRSQVTNILRLLKLDNEIIKALNNDDISFGHARALVPLGDDAKQYIKLIKENNLSVRELEVLLKEPLDETLNNERYTVIRHKNKVTILFNSENEAQEFIKKTL